MIKKLLLFIFLASIPQLWAQITLTATSGTLSATYTTLNAAFVKINDGTHKGDITMQLTGSTNESSSTALLASGTGSASYTSVYIYPTVSGAKISGAQSYLINLTGANNVTIDGRVNASGSVKDLVIEATSGVALVFYNGASNNTLKYTTVKGTSSYEGDILFDCSTGNPGNSNNTIDNCDITNSGGTRSGYGIYSKGFGTTLSSNNVISNCNFYDLSNSSIGLIVIFLQSNNTDWTIRNNSMYETTPLIQSTSNDFRFISVQAADGQSFTIQNNYIGGTQPLCGGAPLTKTNANNNAFYAIFGYYGSYVISGNTISNINWSNNAGADFYGMYFPGIGTGTGNISNNIIGSAAGNNSIQVLGAADYSFYGISWGPSSGTPSFNYNTIGSIRLQNNGTNDAQFNGIYGSLNGSTTGNIIGSLTTANSINDLNLSTVSTQIVMGIYNTGSGSSITISNNTIANLTNGTTGSYGTLTGINNGNGVVIIDNNTVRDLRISNLSTASVNTVIGINMLNSFIAGHQVLGNTIYNLSNDNTGFIGNIIGLYCTDLSPANNSAQNNLIYGLSVLSSGSMISGIYLNSGNWNLMNNMISLGEGVSAGALIYGYYDKGDLTDSHFYNNSIDIRGTVSGTTNFTYALMSASAIASRTYVNNILINERTGGTTGVHYAISLPDGTSNLTNNYNDYFAPNGVPGIYNNIQTTNLSDLQLATGQDANSISRAVTFVSATDLHLSGGSIGDFALTGTPLAE